MVMSAMQWPSINSDTCSCTSRNISSWIAVAQVRLRAAAQNKYVDIEKGALRPGKRKKTNDRQLRHKQMRVREPAYRFFSA